MLTFDTPPNPPALRAGDRSPNYLREASLTILLMDTAPLGGGKNTIRACACVLHNLPFSPCAICIYRLAFRTAIKGIIVMNKAGGHMNVCRTINIPLDLRAELRAVPKRSAHIREWLAATLAEPSAKRYRPRAHGTRIGVSFGNSTLYVPVELNKRLQALAERNLLSAWAEPVLRTGLEKWQAESERSKV